MKNCKQLYKQFVNDFLKEVYKQFSKELTIMQKLQQSKNFLNILKKMLPTIVKIVNYF